MSLINISYSIQGAQIQGLLLKHKIQPPLLVKSEKFVTSHYQVKYNSELTYNYNSQLYACMLSACNDNFFTAWAISATTIAALLAILCVILAAYSFTMLKKYHCDNGINLRHSSIHVNIQVCSFFNHIINSFLRGYGERN